MPWTIILNPRAGRGRAARLLPHLRQFRPADEILLTRAPGEAEKLARHAAAQGHHIAAAGGDGTFHEVLNGALHAAPHTRFALLPCGTGNDLARSLGVPVGLSALRALDEGVLRRIDLGIARSITAGGGITERYWINVAGAGFDAAVAARINRGGRLHGTPAYIGAVLHTLRTFVPAPLTLICDGVPLQQPALLCAIANARTYGGGMRIAPEAELDDGLLDTCLIGGAGPAEFLRAFPAVFRGTHTRHPKVSMNRGAHITLHCAGWPVLLDGEIWQPAAPETLEFTLKPQAVQLQTLSVPPTSAPRASSGTA